MSRLAAITLAGALSVLAVTTAAALPMSPEGQAALEDGRAPVVSIHGCHRDVIEGRYGWHYHYGRHCKRYAVSPPRKYRHNYHNKRRGPRCFTECKYVGPIKFCKKKCH